MLYHKQLYRHKPEEGIYGDCWRTNIACMLNLHPIKVPHFHDGINTQEEIWDKTNLWLAQYDLELIAIPYEFQSVSEFLEYINVAYKGMRLMVAGTSATGVNHSLIAMNGIIEHDPSIDNSGILGPCDDGLYWVEFFVKKSLHR